MWWDLPDEIGTEVQAIRELGRMFKKASSAAAASDEAKRTLCDTLSL